MLLRTGSATPERDAADDASPLAALLPPDLCARLDRLDVLSRRMFAGKLQGERRSKRRGRSVEFDDYRTYSPGDDLRFIDWNALARLDKFFIKVFQEEEDLALHIVLDASASMEAGSPSKSAFAARLAMALAYVGLVNNNRVTLWGSSGAGLSRAGPLRGRRSLPRAAAFILDLAESARRRAASVRPQPGDPRALEASLKSIARARTGKGVLVVISDFLLDRGFEPALAWVSQGIAPQASHSTTLDPAAAPSAQARFQRGTGDPDAVPTTSLRSAAARNAGWDTWCIHVLSPGELDPEAEADPALAPGSDLRFLDAESAQSVEITLTPEVLADYRARVRSFVAHLRRFCRARGMGHSFVTSNNPIDTLILDSLRRGGLLG